MEVYVGYSQGLRRNGGMNVGYYDDIEFDAYNLLEEWQGQAGLYLSYAEDGVDQQEATDNIKDELDLLTAQIELLIRNEEYTLAPEGLKITEKAVSALVACDPQVVAKKRALNKAKKEASLLKKAEIAFEHRKRALENAVILTGRAQYAEPRDRTKTIEKKKQEKTVDDIDSQLNRRRENG